jgi:disulfide bond formation protein DsbB
MTIHELLAIAAAIACVAFLSYASFREHRSHTRAWIYPALGSAVFLGFSVFTVIREGPLGFWEHHAAGGWWGNQIWFDLLINASIAWVMMAQPAKRLGMNLPLWMLLVISTGGIGTLAMLARLQWLMSRTTSANT